jgi:intracellular multiplication protein IcmE
MANENDAKRDIRLTSVMIVGGMVLLVGGGYLVWDYLAKPATAPSKVNIVRVAGAAQNQAPESQAYRDLLQQYNQEGASAARSQNSSFIASMPMEQAAVKKPDVKAPPTPSAETTSRRSHTTQTDNAKETEKKDDPRHKALKKLMAQINPDSAPEVATGLSFAQVMGGSEGAGGGKGSTGGYDQWSETLPGGARLQNASAKSGGESYSAVEVVPPYWRGPGVIDIGVDSDNSTTPVIGKLSGAYAGAVLKAPEGVKLAGDGVVIHFTQMSFKGINYKVDAYALQDDTLLANVASEVNHRYMSRIVLPAVLGGIGNISDLYAQANTQVLTNGFSTQVARPGLPDSTAVAGSILGGAASQAAKVLTEDAARTPATQVRIFQNQVVAIQFMRGVYTGDAVAPGRGGESVQSATPAQAVNSVQPESQSQSQSQSPSSAAPVTADQWRAQTQARIQAQRKLQESQQ